MDARGWDSSVERLWMGCGGQRLGQCSREPGTRVIWQNSTVSNKTWKRLLDPELGILSETPLMTVSQEWEVALVWSGLWSMLGLDVCVEFAWPVEWSYRAVPGHFRMWRKAFLVLCFLSKIFLCSFLAMRGKTKGKKEEKKGKKQL